MRRPVYWKAPAEITRPKETETDVPPPENFSGLRISLLKIGGFFLFASLCLLLLFLIAPLAWWFSLLLALPGYPLLEWLGEKIFADKYGWSTSQVGFSLKRIIFGVLLALTAFGVAYLIFKFVSLLLARHG
jgi:hypothetical protein